MKSYRLRKSILLGVALLLIAATVSACTGDTNAAQPEATVDNAAQYVKINAADAKEMLDSGAEITVLDVREQSEYDSGHIQGAVLLPSGSVQEKAAEVLPDKDATILVYCRSGARSGAAVRTLLSLGYTHVYDLGGLMDWPYEVVLD
jgi:phage shock protein E